MSYRSIRLVLKEDDLSSDILADVFEGEMRAVNQAVNNIYDDMNEGRRNEIISCILNNKHRYLSTVSQKEVEEAIKKVYEVSE